MISLRQTNLFLAFLVFGLLASWATLALARSSTDELGEGRRADPSQFRPNPVNQEAVRAALEFSEFPLAWLGEEFAGYNLAQFIREDREGQDAVYLIYGDCEPAPKMTEPSCVPPLQIVTSAPDSVPGPQDGRITNAGPLTSARGAQARVLSGSPFLWTGGVVITVHANVPLVAEAIDGLRSANHVAMHMDEVTPNDDLTDFGR